MNRLQRALIRAVAGEDAVKALGRPTWWGDIGGSVALGEGGTYANAPSGWRGAVNSNVWAFNCVKARMSLVAQAPLKMYVGTGDEKKEIDKHPALDVLQEVNPINLNARSLMRGIEQQLSIYGRCLVHKVRAISVKELYILPMEYVELVPSETAWLEGYRWLPTGEIIPRADVVDFFYPSANGSVYADSPASVALNSINRYNLADKSQASIDKRGGQKGGILIHPKDEISEDFLRVRDEWDRKRADVDSAGRDMHVPNGTDWRGDAFSATEMQREERNQRLAKEIMAAFSVPPAAAGDYRDASVLANAATQMSAFWNMFGVEELKFIAEEFTYSLLWAEWKDTKKKGYYFEHDLTDVQALREDADALAQRSIILYQGGISSLNEARELAGLDRSEDPRADAIPVPELPQQEEAPAEDVSNDTQIEDDVDAEAGDAEVDALAGEVDDLLAEIDDTAAKAVGRPEKGDRDGDGIFNEGSKPAGGDGAKVSPVTGRSLKRVQEGPTPEEKKAAKEKERAQKKAESQRQREQKKAESAKQREQKKAESAKQKEQAKAAKKKEQIDKLDEEAGKLQAAYDSIKDRDDVEPKLKQKVIDTIAKVRAKRDALATGQSEATSSVLQDVARIPGKAFMPVVDFVGMNAVDFKGDELGTIEKIHRFGLHDGIEATKALPVVVVNGKAFSAGDVWVVTNGEEEGE
jgi:HK97 family phage portal protein